MWIRVVCCMETAAHSTTTGEKMRIVDDTIFLTSLPDLYNVESFDLKRNTIRFLGDEDLKCIRDTPPKYIQIHQIGMMEKTNCFRRELTNISFHKNLAIFSW